MTSGPLYLCFLVGAVIDYIKTPTTVLIRESIIFLYVHNSLHSILPISSLYCFPVIPRSSSLSVVEMAATRATTLAMSRRVATVCRPRIHFAVRATAVARPWLPKAPIGISRSSYSTEVPKPQVGVSKLVESADEAVADIKSGSTILSAGFGLCGVAGKVPTRDDAGSADLT